MTQMVMCLTGDEIKTPYVFRKSRTAIYSLEEALYYTYTNWQYTDYTSDTFLNWVDETLKLKDIANKLKKIQKETDYTSRLLKFLTIIPFFDPITLSTLKSSVEIWSENSRKIIFKEQGDTLLDTQPQDAIVHYKNAVKEEEDAEIYNNMGIAYANDFNYTKAISSFEKAIKLEPENTLISLNLAYVLIENKNIASATHILEKVIKKGENSYVHFLYSKVYEAQKDIQNAIDSLKKAIELKPKRKYFYGLSKLYSKSRRFTDAIDILERIENRDSDFYIALADAFASVSDFPKAITTLDEAIKLGKNDGNTLATLANYHRQNYNLDKALAIVEKALSIENNNEMAKLEEAKIKKAQGKLRDYQKIMDNILTRAKQDWRDNN